MAKIDSLLEWKRQNPDRVKFSAVEWRKSNPEKIKAYNLKQYNKRKEERREWWDEVKNHPCQDCGGKFHPSAMEFHHVNGDKEFTPSRGIYTMRKERILKEIEKCILICANCHRVRHNG